MADFRIKLDTSLDSSKAKSDFEALKSQLEGEGVKLKLNVSKFKSDMNIIKTTLNNAFKLDGKQNNGLDKIMATMKEINKLSKGMQNNLFGGKENTSSIDRTMKKYDQLMAKKQTLDKQLNSMKVGSLSSEQAKQIDKLRDSLKGFDKFKIDTSDITKSKEDMKSFENTLKEVKRSLGDMNVDLSFTKQFDKAQKDIEALTGKLNKLKTQNVDGKFIDTSEIDKAISKLKELSKIKVTPDMDNATGQLKEYVNEIEKCQTAYKNMNNAMSANKSSMNSINSSLSGSKKLFNDFYTSIASYSIGDMLADGIISGVRNIKSTIIDLDSAFRDLAKVAPESFRGTKEEFDHIRDSAVKAGQEVAKSSIDIINSTSNALQSGFKSIDEAMKYAKESAKFSNVSDMTQEMTDTALRSILSSYGGVENALKGTNSEIQNATKSYSMLNRVMDASNYLGNNYSTSTQSIAEGMQNAGSALKAMNVGLEDGMAYFVAIDEVMQNSGMSSNGLKAIAMNLSGISVSAKDGSLGLNKSAKALKNFADIDVQKPNGELKDMGVVLDELGGKWETLSKTEQQALMNAIGGKQRSAQFAALMQNWETVKKIQQEIGSGMAIGSADRENEAFINSLEGKITRLKESLTKLATTVISSDMFGGMIDGANAVVNAINSVISVFDKLGVTTPVLMGSLAGLFTTVKSLGNDKSIPNYGKSIFDTFKKTSPVIEGTGRKISNLSNESSRYAGKMRMASTETAKLSKNTQSLSKGFMSSKLGSVAANVGVTLLNSTIMALAGVGISMAIKGIDNFVNKQEKLAEASRGRQADIKAEIDSTKQQVSGLSSISKEYDKLANKTNKSKEEMERFNELKNEIAAISPDLSMGVDGENNAILALNGSLENTIKLKRESLELSEAILNAEKKNEIEANRDKTERLKEQAGKLSNDYKGKNPNNNPTKDFMEGKGNKNSTVLYDGDVKAYRDSLQKKNDAYTKYISDMSKKRSEYNELELKAQQVAMSEMNSTLSGKNLNDKAIQNANSIAAAFDWGNLSAGETQKVQQGLSKISNEFGKFKVDNFQSKLSNLSKDFEAGSITQDQYNDGLKGLAKSLNDAGVEIDQGTLLKALKQFPPQLEQIEYEMAGFLKNKGFKLSDVGTNGMATMLADQFKSIKNLSSQFASSIETSGTITVDLIPEVGSEIYKSLPTQIQGAIDSIMQDGDVNKQEAEILMELMTKWEQNGEISPEELKELERLNGKEMTAEMRAKLEADVDEDYKKYVINNTEAGKSLESTITAKFKANGQDEYNSAYQKAGVDPNSKEGKKITNEIDAKFQQQGFEASKNVAGVMDSLGLTSEKQQAKFLSTIEAKIETGELNVGQLQDAHDTLKWLNDHPDVAKEVGLTVEEDGSIKEVEEYLARISDVPDETNKKVNVETQEASNKIEDIVRKIEGLNLSEDEVKNIMVAIENGDLSVLEQSLSSLPPEKRIEVMTSIANALAGLNTVEARQLRDKILQLLAKDQATPKVESANKKKLEDKRSNLTANDKASSVIDSINNKKIANKSFSITTTITKIWKNINKGGTTSKGQDAGQISLSSNSEQSQLIRVAPMSESSEGAQPLDGVSTPSVPQETSQVSTRSASNFGGILTASTKLTKLQSSYKTILNMIKYGINVFQELENRISRVNNQLSLLDLKMKNATGTDKIKYLETQNKLYKEQAKLQKDLFDSLNVKRKALYGKVESIGFNIDSQGNLTNYEETLNKLESAYESAKKKEESYTGKSESTKKKYAKATEEANKKLEEAKKLSSEYLDVFYKDLPEAEQKWQELQNAIKENNDAIEQLKFEDKIYKEVHAIDELSKSYEQYSNYLDRAIARKERYSGEKQLKYMKQELEYSQKLIEIQEQMKKQLGSQRKDYKKQLNDYGVKFTEGTGQIDNYDEILNKYQNTSDYDKVKKWMDEYHELLMTEREATNEIEDLKNSIQDLNNEIKIIELEEKISSANNAIGDTSQKIENLNNKLALIDVKLQHANGMDKINLIDEQIKLWEELSKYQESNLDNLLSGLKIYQDELSKYGFKFDEFGNIQNMESNLDSLKDSADYDYIKDTIDKWKELYNNSIPEAEQALGEYENAIKDANNTKLEIAKSVEDKITEMIKSQLEKRKEAIRKQADEEIKLINKRKEAYNQMREQANYEDDYDEQMKKINKLKQQIEIAQRDDSLSGKKKLEELLAQLDEENKNLQDLVQEKTDKDINDLLDKELNKAHTYRYVCIKLIELRELPKAN